MMDSLKALLEDQVKDLYSAESQLIKALPKMAKAATSDALREALENHLEETRGHRERLQDAAQLLDISPGRKKCKGMEGLIEEGNHIIQEEGDGDVIDAGLIAAAQRIEHYEISAYGTVRAIAERMGEDRLVQLFEEILEQEKAADEKLTGISVREVLQRAAANGRGRRAA